ncbi:MAG: MBL fold metallo-hydrolase [Bacteroidota bacterium]|nr:MBL fold metallo-hydrolase [Bacteroidota bacterium]
MPFNKFGKVPSGSRLERIKKSPHYRNGQLHNVNHTPQLTEGATIPRILYSFIFGTKERKKPVGLIPSIKTNLHSIATDVDVLVWFGHSSYFIQIDGLKFLIDPVFSGNASPLSGSNKSFPGSDIYTTDDMPEIDYMLITHDHYDHVDYHTIEKLRPKIKTVICGLGVGEHFEYWDYDPSIITEADWDERIDLKDGFALHTTSALHFSGRGLTRNKSIWLSYTSKTANTIRNGNTFTSLPKKL